MRPHLRIIQVLRHIDVVRASAVMACVLPWIVTTQALARDNTETRASHISTVKLTSTFSHVL